MNEVVIDFYIAMKKAEIEFMEEYGSYPPSSFEFIFKKGWNMGRETQDYIKDPEELFDKI